MTAATAAGLWYGKAGMAWRHARRRTWRRGRRGDAVSGGKAWQAALVKRGINPSFQRRGGDDDDRPGVAWPYISFYRLLPLY